jgi:sugar-specific transcriptional regulator TrmB
MDTRDIVVTLEGLGLPAKAASIYLALLGRQKMGVAELARESAIKRGTCYEYLDLLLKKEFIIRVPVGKRMFFAAVSPAKVLAKHKREARHVETVLNELATVHETAVHKPNVTFYEGKRELQRIYEEMFQTMGDAASIFPAEEFFKNFTTEEYDAFDQELTRNALKSRDLFIADKSYKKIKDIRAKNGGFKTDKKLPSWFNSNVDVLIYADKVALISLRDLSAIVIENRDIADLFKNMHSFMWKSL